MYYYSTRDFTDPYDKKFFDQLDDKHKALYEMFWKKRLSDSALIFLRKLKSQASDKLGREINSDVRIGFTSKEEYTGNEILYQSGPLLSMVFIYGCIVVQLTSLDPCFQIYVIPGIEKHTQPSNKYLVGTKKSNDLESLLPLVWEKINQDFELVEGNILINNIEHGHLQSVKDFGKLFSDGKAKYIYNNEARRLYNVLESNQTSEQMKSLIRDTIGNLTVGSCAIPNLFTIQGESFLFYVSLTNLGDALTNMKWDDEKFTEAINILSSLWPNFNLNNTGIKLISEKLFEMLSLNSLSVEQRELLWQHKEFIFYDKSFMLKKLRGAILLKARKGDISALSDYISLIEIQKIERIEEADAQIIYELYVSKESSVDIKNFITINFFKLEVEFSYVKKNKYSKKSQRIHEYGIFKDWYYHEPFSVYVKLRNIYAGYFLIDHGSFDIDVLKQFLENLFSLEIRTLEVQSHQELMTSSVYLLAKIYEMEETPQEQKMLIWSYRHKKAVIRRSTYTEKENVYKGKIELGETESFLSSRRKYVGHDPYGERYSGVEGDRNYEMLGGQEGDNWGKVETEYSKERIYTLGDYLPSK